MKKVINIIFPPIAYFLLLGHQKPAISSYVDVTLLSDDILDTMMKTELSYMGNHLTSNENNKLSKRKKRNDTVTDDIYFLTSMLSQIIPPNFSVYSLNLPDETINTNNSDINNFLDLVNIYDPDINNTITNHFNQIQPIKGCEDDIKNHNCHRDVLTCITLKKNYLSESCKKSLSNSLLYSCADDFLFYCKDYSKFSKVYKCLKKNFYHLSNQCLNILSYYEDIMQKLHKIKSKPYDKKEHLFLEQEKENTLGSNTDRATIGSIGSKGSSSNHAFGNYNLKGTDTGNNKPDEQYHLFNNHTINSKPTMADNLRKGYGHYIFPSMDYNYIFDFNSRSYEYKYFLYFFECLFISFLLYILIICIKKYYVTDPNKFFFHNEKSKLAHL
ncbi:conserved Plasmodium protein, unknown function [Plasmodium ovale]|uniref:Uncharacterized protein n=2 Tax=Plasmodium ovale TaxID=36330 RepID=A0A1A8WM11_PLAOA|nr:conserved Plasmodium protein, unknown function [Plasmodium ovale curtisi]SBS93957.1 conserved Plasmodium protein, unknown function [Plasmodium ovale curtisi]SCP04967.1 conserved Plasmodium protein, unknown function [Plasmodium ovale]